MSMLGRYKKKGGFLQLLVLMETSGKEKQEKFLKLILEEDARWAEAIKQKMLSVEKIFTWDDNTVAEICAKLNDLTIAVALHALGPSVYDKTFKMMSQSRKKKIEEMMIDKKPNAAEVSTIFVQILTEVRQLIAQGFVYIDKIDPNLAVDPDIEEKLASSTLFTMSSEASANSMSAASSTESAPTAASSAGSSNSRPTDLAEIEALKRRLNQLMAENNGLKEKLVQTEHRISQIRKLAA